MTEAWKYAGDIEPHDDVEKTIDIIRGSYGWTLTDDGRLCGLVAGDMGYASTHIVIDNDRIEMLEEALTQIYNNGWYFHNGIRYLNESGKIAGLALGLSIEPS